MQRIPLPRNIFDALYTAYNLRCYCGNAGDNKFGTEYLPGRFTGLAAGETVKLFATGPQKRFREIYAEVISTDPIEIKILNIKPSFYENHPAQYERLMEARAQGF